MAKWHNPQLLLEWAREIGKTNIFLDLHVHPFEVLCGDVNYKPNPQTKGIFSKGVFTYHPPKIEATNNFLLENNKTVLDNQNADIMAGRLIYNHVGPKVFLDQIDLIGISGALLLPVARTPGKSEEMLEVSQKMFQLDDRLFPGCAFPIGVKPDELDVYFRSAQKINRIHAIKLHPNLAGIDSLSEEGQNLINACLVVAGELNLPIVLHGGRTPAIERVEQREFGTISHLAMVNWNISSAPVIFAHAGCYGLSNTESMEALSILTNLLDKHSNLMADVSNLEPSILQLVLEKISPDRLIFGSDALYVPVWKAWIRFLQTLQLVSPCPDDDLIRIASINPARCLSRSPVH